ncbi:diphthine--ammonia ligase [Chitinophagaceae bacterium LWZ2-11]
MRNTLCSWSGGKDSCFALMQAVKEGHTPSVLLNVLNERGKISRSHGIPSEILQAQANAIGLPIHMISSSWTDYEQNFISALQQLTKEHQLNYAVFGDIDLQPHRDWEEKVCAAANLKPLLPLWQQNRKQLVLQMLENGIETIIVSCNVVMGESFLGRTITKELIEELEALGIDACGENGEYHTLVLNAPLFKHRIDAKVLNTHKHEQYWFTELALI